MSIPTIDLGDDPDQVAAAIDAACVDVGFFSIVGHGVPSSVIDDAWRTTWEFFDLPLAAKLAARHPDDPAHPYGYFPAGREALAASLGRVTPFDLKESFNIAPPSSHEDPTGRFAGPDRIWPDSPEAFERSWTAYYDEMVGLAGRLLHAMARALSVADDHFDAAVDQHLSALRGLNYPPLDAPPLPGQLRAGDHSDYGTLTILLPGSGSGGLEVLATDGRWVPVQPIADGFVVNLGDAMQQWTNDRWRSTRHRVALPADDLAGTERRQSLAFFHQPNWNARMQPVPTCVGPGRPARYDTVQAGPWLMDKFTAASG